MPSDIDPQSGFRLPLPKREDLDEVGRKAYDRAATPGTSLAGLQGPAGVRLYSTKITEHMHAINQYLRFQSGFTPRIREIVMMAGAYFEVGVVAGEGAKFGQPEVALEIVRRTRDAVAPEKPVTVKMRRGLDDSEHSRDSFFAILDGAFEVAIRGGDDAHIDVLGLCGTHGANFSVLQNAQ